MKRPLAPALPTPGRRRLSRIALLLAAGSALGALPGLAGPAPPPALTAPAHGVEISQAGGLATAIAHLPGVLLASAVARDNAGEYGLALLVAGDPNGRPGPPAERDEAIDDPAPGQPRSVWFFEPRRGTLANVADALPEKVNAMAALTRSGNSGDELLVGEPGILYALEAPSPGGAPVHYRMVFSSPGLDLRSLHHEAGQPLMRLPWVPVAHAGKLELLEAGGGAADPLDLHPAASFPLPQTAAREAWGIQLTSQPTHLLPLPPAASPQPASAGSTLRFAVGPEAEGKQRLRTLLFTTTPATPPIEAWSLRPAAGQADEGHYDLWDGRPVLLLSSVPKIGIFVKRDVEVFLLTRDRSRGGSSPVLKAHTECHIWQSLTTHFADLDGSGHQDLVLIYPDGMRGKKLHFDVWTGLGEGRFAPQPSTSLVDVEADDWFYGADFSGDGVPDLLVKRSGHLFLYPGIGKTHRVAERPSWEFNLPVPPPVKHAPKDDEDDDTGDLARSETPALGRLGALVDLESDGKAVLFLAVADQQGHSQIVAVLR